MSATEVASAFVALVPSTKGFGRSTEQQLGGPVKSAGKFLGLGFGKVFGIAAAGVAAIGFGKLIKDSIGSFKDLSLQVIKLRRVTGSTTKEASRLRFAINESGVDVDKTTASFVVFSKRLGTAAGDQKKTAALTKLMGINFLDARGHIKPMSELIVDLARRFKAMPDGVEKTSLAVQLFGRSGTQLLPFLNKGSDGITELMEKSDKLGLTLNDTALDKFGKYREASRTFKATLEGLKVTIGGALIPVVTAFLNLMTTAITPAIQSGIRGIKRLSVQLQPVLAPILATVTVFATRIGRAFGILFGRGGLDQRISKFSRRLDGAFGNTGKIAGPLSVALRMIAHTLNQAIAGIQQGLPVVLDLGRSIGHALLPVLLSLAATFIGKVLPATIAVGHYLASLLIPIVGGIVKVIRQALPVVASLAQFFADKLYPAVVAIVLSVGKQLKPVFDAMAQAIQRQILPLVSQLIVKFKQWQPTLQRVALIVLKIVGFLLRLAAAIIARVLPIVIRLSVWLQVHMIKAIAVAVGAIIGLIGALIRIGGAVGRAVAAVVRFNQAIGRKIGNLVSFFTSVPGRIISALGDLSHLLVDAGKSLIGGLLDGIKGKFNDVKDTLGGLTKNLPHWKGPESTDAVILRPAGRSVIQGFMDGIDDQTPDLRSQLQSLTAGIPKSAFSPGSAAGGAAAAAASKGRHAFVVTNWHEGRGFFEDVADDRIDSAADLRAETERAL